MKTKLTALAMTMILVALVAGCSFTDSLLEEYMIGGIVHEVDGTYVDIRVMLWTFDDSGFIKNGEWAVNWGDGRWSSEADAMKVEAIREWEHIYYTPGNYVIVVSHGGAADPLILNVEIE